MAIIDRRGVTVDAATPASGSDPNPGLAVKAAVRAATTANITLAGLQSIDGIALAANDRVLVKNQTTASQNGIYNASSGNWTRALDFDSNSAIAEGMEVMVNKGSTQGRTKWFITSSDPMVIGTSSITFAQIELTAATVTALLASVAAVLAGTVITATNMVATFVNARLLAAIAPISLTDAGAGSTLTIALAKPLANLTAAPVSKTASFNVAAVDSGTTYYLGGSGGQTATIGVASGFSAGDTYRFHNASTRGWSMAINGITTFYLYPGQTVTINKEGTGWAAYPARQRYLTTDLVCYVDQANGSASNDGLAAGAGGAFDSLQVAWDFIKTKTDSATAVIQLAAATYTVSSPVVFSSHPVGHHIVTIRGDTANPTNYIISVAASIQGMQVVDFATVIFEGIEFTGNGASTIFYVHQHSIIDFDHCYFGSNATGVMMAIEDGGKVNFTGPTTINGNATYFASVSAGGNLRFGGTTYTMPNALAFTAFLNLAGSGADVTIDATASFTGTGSGAGSSGLKYQAALNSTVQRNGVTIPGASAGTTATGAQAT